MILVNFASPERSKGAALLSLAERKATCFLCALSKEFIGRNTLFSGKLRIRALGFFHHTIEADPPRIMLHLYQLETFLVLATTRNFTETALKLGYSQSTVSIHIKALERELGGPLFLRWRFCRTVTLTQVGNRAVVYARRLLALAAEAKAALRDKERVSGHKRVVVESAALKKKYGRKKARAFFMSHRKF